MPRCSRVNIQHVVADDFDFVRKQFDERVPAVLFQSKHCGDATVLVGISQGETFGSSTWTCDLLRTYCRIDERVALLAIAFRYWAKVRLISTHANAKSDRSNVVYVYIFWAQLCKIDLQSHGSLPAYVYIVMTVYFLQQCNPPVLPVLHEVASKTSEQVYCFTNSFNVFCFYRLRRKQSAREGVRTTTSSTTSTDSYVIPIFFLQKTHLKSLCRALTFFLQCFSSISIGTATTRSQRAHCG